MKPENIPLFKDCLREAKDLLKEAVEFLELETYDCDGCGALKYYNFDDKIANQSLQAAITRLDLTLKKKGGTFVYD